MQTFRDIGEEALFFRRQQITKYTHVYSITLQVACPRVVGGVVNIEPILQIMEDADFHITHMTGSVVDTVDENGVRYHGDFSSGLIFAFPMAGAPSKGERGIWFKFENPKINRPLQVGIPTNDAVIQAAQYLSPYDQTLVEFNSVFMPGYGYSWGKPIKFDYTLMRNERLKIILQNRQRVLNNGTGETAGFFSRVSIAFIGHRYEN